MPGMLRAEYGMSIGLCEQPGPQLLLLFGEALNSGVGGAWLEEVGFVVPETGSSRAQAGLNLLCSLG